MIQFSRVVAGLVATLAVAFHASPTLAGPALVVDARTGEVLVSEDAGKAWHPASTTKMMTAYVALKALKAGRIGLETAIPASKLAAAQQPVKVHIKAGQEITLDNALKIMMVKSANDISYVIAEGVGGTVENFVAMMNAEALRLGLNNSRFVNPNGWHHPAQQTSARDLAVLTLALMRDFPEYGGYWNIGAVQLGKRTLNNTNGLIGRYAGASGFKTGFVCASGFNVVATANRGGRTLIAVVLGAMSGAERTVRAAQLLDEGFGKWGSAGYSVASIPNDGGTASSICEELKRRGRGVVFSDDADFEGPVSFGTATQLAGGNTESGREPITIQAQRSATVTRSTSGRLTLGPRAEFQPIPVAFGRTAGTASAPIAANVAEPRPTAVAAVPNTANAATPTSTRVISARTSPVVASAGSSTDSPASNPILAVPAAASAFAASIFAGRPAVAPSAADTARASVPLSPQGEVRPGAAAGIRPPASPFRQQAGTGDGALERVQAAKAGAAASTLGTVSPLATQKSSAEAKAVAAKSAASKNPSTKKTAAKPVAAKAKLTNINGSKTNGGKAHSGPKPLTAPPLAATLAAPAPPARPKAAGEP
jgi:D-alanyl-D-alanine carboxypeptidase